MKIMFIKFLQKNPLVSLLLLLHLFCLIVKAVDSFIVRRKNAIEMLGPRPNGIVDKLQKAYPQGTCSLFYNHPTHLEEGNSFWLSSTSTNVPNQILTRTIWGTQKYIKELAEGCDPIVLIDETSDPMYMYGIDEDCCVMGVIVEEIMKLGVLVLSTGTKKTKDDFLGHTIMQAATNPIFNYQYKKLFSTNKNNCD